MPTASHPAAIPTDELLEACVTRRGRRSGPGGQHRNKVETAIVITHQPTGVRAEATERRSQEQNRQVAVFRLRVNLALQVRGEFSEPSVLWRSRCRGGRIQASGQHDDFPALLAEALNAASARQWDLKEAAESLQLTTSQLIKFFKTEPKALALVNEQRRERGLHDLR